MTLSHQAARQVYDRIGRAQDWQGFYEGRAVRRLIARGAFEDAHAVAEFGFGTGRLAAELLSGPLPEHATYVGFDISATMERLARRRLAPWGERTRLIVTDGSPLLPLADRSCDRLISTYTLDLLEERDQAVFLDEASRVVEGDGLLCLASITPGRGGLATTLSDAWEAVWRRMPALVGGCRPIHLAALLDARWDTAYRATVRPWGVTSEILVARRTL